MRKSPIKLNDICWKKKKKKTEAILFRTGRKTFLFSLHLAVERDSTLSVVYLRARADIGRETLQEEKRQRGMSNQKGAKRKRERERDYWNIYWKVDFPAHPEITAGKFGKRKRRRGREERGAGISRSVKREITVFVVENALRINVAQPCRSYAS